MTWTTVVAPDTTTKTSAAYSGATIGITLAPAGGAYVDQASLMKWVDASVKNGGTDWSGSLATYWKTQGRAQGIPLGLF